MKLKKYNKWTLLIIFEYVKLQKIIWVKYELFLTIAEVYQ